VRIRSVFNHSAQAVAEGVLVSLLVVGLMAGTAFAARGGTGGHKGSGGTTSTSATVSVDPNIVAVGAYYTVSGCGYKAGAPLDIKLYSATATLVLFTGGDASGCFSMSNNTWTASAIRVEAWQYTGKWALMATTSFTVQ
jgi:hypothetical protein